MSSFAPIRAILLLLAVVSFTGMPYTVLMPMFASKVLHGGPHTLGLLMASTGVGAVIGALWLASRRSVLGLGRMVAIAGALFGAGLVAFSRVARRCGCRSLLLMITGGGMMVQMAATNTLLQTLVDEDKRGRVMSFYTMAFFGMMPFGSLVAGCPGRAHRRAGDGGVGRRGDAGGGGDLRAQAARAARAGAADLRAPRHPVADRRRVEPVGRAHQPARGVAVCVSR